MSTVVLDEVKLPSSDIWRGIIMCWRVEFLEQSSMHHSLPLSSFNLSSPVSLYEVKTVIVCVCAGGMRLLSYWVTMELPST